MAGIRDPRFPRKIRGRKGLPEDSSPFYQCGNPYDVGSSNENRLEQILAENIGESSTKPRKILMVRRQIVMGSKKYGEDNAQGASEREHDEEGGDETSQTPTPTRYVRVEDLERIMEEAAAKGAETTI
ncbi:hypothetical protein Salat_1847900 [Sesamum alatum]|uniref:Uncharacterized protein n=1 Tax=Sesamum alatum TaxID=300844 RepID=A0AAE1Y3Q1_9LAMI|nr:hypothetical protein Salat_1847900 [Sesamum alatum]